MLHLGNFSVSACPVFYPLKSAASHAILIQVNFHRLAAIQCRYNWHNKVIYLTSAVSCIAQGRENKREKLCRSSRLVIIIIGAVAASATSELLRASKSERS